MMVLCDSLGCSRLLLDVWCHCNAQLRDTATPPATKSSRGRCNQCKLMTQRYRYCSLAIRSLTYLVDITIERSQIFHYTLDDMSPAIIEEHGDHEVAVPNKEATQPRYPEPLKLSGALDQFKHEDTTPVIGREFFDVNIVDDLLNAENADERLRDIAITSMCSSWTLDLCNPLTDNYSSLTAWCGLLPRAEQSYRCPPERLCPQAGSAEWKAERFDSTHPPSAEQHQ